MFETQIDKFVIDTEQKMLIVVRESISAVVEEAQKPVAVGGKMRVKTGFLRATGLAQIGSVPSGPSKSASTINYNWEGNQLGITLAKLKIGDTFYFGWTANYAKYREAYDGFLESAVQKWQSYVDESIRRFKK